MYDTRKDPWINAPLTISPENPNQAAAVLVHPYVVNPPFWSVDYRFSLCDSQGNEIRSDKVTMKRGWIPKQCFDGSYPDPVTLMCPPLPEAHPWIPGMDLSSPMGKKIVQTKSAINKKTADDLRSFFIIRYLLLD